MISSSGPRGSTDTKLRALITVLKEHNIKTGIKIGGMRWGDGRCDLSAGLKYAAIEQEQVGRWIELGGDIDSVTTDHANVWNVRGLSSRHAGVSPCVPAVPMKVRIGVVAQIFGSWRKFLGSKASLGFIESLGFRDEFHQHWPFEPYSGLDPKARRYDAAASGCGQETQPTLSVPLLNHFQIDFGLGGVE